MKMPLLAAAIVLISSVQAFGQSCGCGSHHPVMAQPVASCGCDSCCNRCERPLLELVEGIGFTLKTTACKIKSGVHRLFHPITFHGCNSCSHVAKPSCGCGSEVHSMGSYEMVEPGMQYIEPTPSHPQVPSIPGPPATKEPSAAPPKPTAPTTPDATEPSKLNTPRMWEPVGTRPTKGTQVTRSTRNAPTPATRPQSSTTRAATYYAPSRNR